MAGFDGEIQRRRAGQSINTATPAKAMLAFRLTYKDRHAADVKLNHRWKAQAEGRWAKD
jgi:hypothetical protein